MQLCWLGVSLGRRSCRRTNLEVTGSYAMRWPKQANCKVQRWGRGSLDVGLEVDGGRVLVSRWGLADHGRGLLK